MAENTTTNETQNKEEQSSNKTYIFPSKLRTKVDDGHPFIQFNIVQKDDPNTTDIFLYQPTGIAVSDGATYTNLDMGVMGAGLNLINKGGDPKGNFTQADSIAAGILGKDAISSLTGLDVSKGGSIGALKAGIAANPYTRIAFEGTAIRTFEFNFKLIPENKKETETAKIIERTFRKFLYPKKAGSIALAYPPLFNIRFWVNGQPSPYMPVIKPAYLTSLQTTFNETANSVFQGTGAPIEISLGLGFQEERQLVRDDLYPNDTDIDEQPNRFFQGGPS